MDEAPLAVTTVSIPGVSGEMNNAVGVFGDVLTAPFAPTGVGLAELEGEDFDPAALDNHFVYLIDDENPSAPPKTADIGCYWPTRLCFDEETRTVFARGTVYVPLGNGKLQPAQVISYVHFNDKGEFETPVKVPVIGVETDPTQVNIPWGASKWASSAPHDFGLGRDGRYLVFTNGASVFTFNTIEGYINQKNLIDPTDYNADNTISRLDVHSESNTVIVTVNESIKKKGSWRHFSDIYILDLGESGGLDLVAKISRDALPGGAALTHGSEVEIELDPETGSPRAAFFVLDNGAFCAAALDDLGEDKEAKVTELAAFDELAASDDRLPRSVEIDPKSKGFGLSKGGFALQIRRPVWAKPGKRGRIARSFELHHFAELPALAVVKLGDDGQVVERNLITDFGEPELAISNVVFDEDSRVMFSSSSGRLLMVGANPGELLTAGDLGTGVSSISYDPSRLRLVGIRSFDADQSGVITEGAVLIARRSPDESETGEPAFSLLASGGLSRLLAVIRKPIGFIGSR
jgi:hypothetical protein